MALHLGVVLSLTVAQAAGAAAPPPRPAPEAPLSEFPGQYAPTPAGAKYPVWPTGCAHFDPAERIACLESIVFDFGDLARFAAANAALAQPRAGERRVVFLGDSITDEWSKARYGGFFPGKPYVNRGIGGQTTAQILLRFRADVLANRPEGLVILAGTNDIAGNAGPQTLGEIEANLATMAELGKLHGIRVVLSSLTPVCDATKDEAGRPRIQTTSRPPETIRALNRWIADYAAENDDVYLDYYAAMADPEGLLRPELTEDGLHPNAAGYAVMAPLAEKAIERALGSGM